jgi:hypothetical protein
MSKFIIGNKPISSVSGPVRVTVLKPNNDLKTEFENKGGRLPYIILFGDQHFSREGNCDSCKCNINWITEKGWENKDCCYEVDDPEFLKLFDGVASKNYPIDFYVEQIYEPRLGDPNILSINEGLNRVDTTGYLSKLTLDYKICYSKADRRTKRYKTGCPTRDIRWHFIDTRSIEYGNSGEAKLYKGIIQFYTLLYYYFDKNRPENENDSFQESITLFKKYTEELTMLFDILINGPDFLDKYITKDGNFLLSKQIRKQVLEDLKNVDFWKKIITDRIQETFYDYMNTVNTNFNTKDYVKVMTFYKNVLILISAENISKDEFLEKRKTLIESISNYNIFEENPSNLITMISLTTFTGMMDAYTISRILKKPTNGIPSFTSLIYAGDLHVKNIIDILTKYFKYEVIGQSYSDKLRCQDVKNIEFNLLKAKQEYK